MSTEPTKEMKAYAVEQMVLLLENISRQPIDCYSVKERGAEKKYYLGRSYVENLIANIKKYNK